MIGQEFIKNKITNYRENILSKVDLFKNIIQNAQEAAAAAKKNRASEAETVINKSTSNDPEKNAKTERQRENLRKRFENQEDTLEAKEKAREDSMLKSQGVSDHSGSAYNGPGKPLNGKVNANMGQRNFDNHQGN